MEEFKEYIDDSANEEERQAAELIGEGLVALRLRQKVQKAADERKKWQNIKYWLLGGFTLCLLSSGLYLYGSGGTATKEETPVIDTQLPPVEEKEPAVIDPPQIETIQEEPETPEENPRQETPAQMPPPADLPIAQATPSTTLPPPAYGAPATYLRGQSTEEQDKTLLNQLWYTNYPLTGLTIDEKLEEVNSFLQERKFPLAYVGLQRLTRQAESALSDTLIYLQAYTLMEMGQGKEANQLLDQLDQAPDEWQTQINWYRGLSHLLADQKEEALVIFKAIAKQEDHPYYLQAKKSIELYDE